MCVCIYVYAQARTHTHARVYIPKMRWSVIIEFSFCSYTITLNKQCGVPLEKITYFGHSLGAHVCGFAGKNIKSLGFEIELIIGADPARPLFSGNKPEDRLCDSDAKRLVVFHTSQLGMAIPMGDLDLYFNGGQNQPGCGTERSITSNYCI